MDQMGGQVAARERLTPQTELGVLETPHLLPHHKEIMAAALRGMALHLAVAVVVGLVLPGLMAVELVLLVMVVMEQHLLYLVVR
jgi:hypothetical protein